MTAEHDAITRALDNCDILMRAAVGMEASALARSQLDALLAENARLREALTLIANDIMALSRRLGDLADV